MEGHIFEVELPEGHIVEVEAPQDTPQEAIRRKVYQHVLQNPELSPSIAKQQGAGYKSPVYPSGTRTWPEVASDQAANVVKGVPQAVLGLPGAAVGAGKTAVDIATGKGTKSAQDLLTGSVAPFKPIVTQPSPESPE